MDAVYPEIPVTWLLGKQERLAPVQHLDQLRSNIAEFGFSDPVILDSGYQVVAGCEQLLAACSLGMLSVPYVQASALSPERQREISQALQEQLSASAWL